VRPYKSVLGDEQSVRSGKEIREYKTAVRFRPHSPRSSWTFRQFHSRVSDRLLKYRSGFQHHSTDISGGRPSLHQKNCKEQRTHGNPPAVSAAGMALSCNFDPPESSTLTAT